MTSRVRTVLRRPGRMAQLLRYSAVSGISTVTSLTILGVLVGLFGVDAVLANVLATAVGTVPSFELNRRWVWRRHGRRSLLGQIVPFTALSFTGLLVSTVAVGLVSGRTVGWSHWGHTLAVELANAAAYGSLWVVQYVVLDRVLFRNRDEVRGTDPDGDPAFTGERQTAPRRVGPVNPMLGSGAHRPAVTGSRGVDHE